MTVINTNNAALKAQLASKIADRKLTESGQRLSSGKRINGGADDAAGAAVALKLDAQIQGQKAAIKTASDAVSLLKLQEAGVSQFVNIIQRIRELSVQMANGTFSNNDRSLAQLEVDALTTQFGKVASGTKFNNKQILNASSNTTYQIQSGANQDENFTISVIEGATLATNVSTDSDVTSQSNAQLTMNSMITHLNTAEGHLATIGASINRLYATINNLSASSVNTKVALGRISDTDFARESTNLAKQQILSNSANQMLVTSNRSKNLLIALLE